MALSSNNLNGLTRPVGSLSNGLSGAPSVEPFHNLSVIIKITPFSTVNLAVLGDFEWNDGDGVWIPDSFNEVVITGSQADGIISIRNTIGGTDTSEVIFALNASRNDYLNIDIQQGSTILRMNNMCENAENLESFSINDSSNVTEMISTFAGCTSLACIGAINSINASLDTNDMFLNTTALINPTPAEQTAILNGSNYINANACP